MEATAEKKMRMEAVFSNGHGRYAKWNSNNVKPGTREEQIVEGLKKINRYGLSTPEDSQDQLVKTTKQRLLVVPEKPARPPKAATTQKTEPQPAPEPEDAATKVKKTRKRKTKEQKEQEAAEKKRRSEERAAKRAQKIAEKEARALKPKSKNMLFTHTEMERMDFDLIMKRMLMYYEQRIDRVELGKYLLTINDIYQLDWLDTGDREVAGAEATNLVMTILDYTQVWNWIVVEVFQTFKHLMDHYWRRTYELEYRRQLKKLGKAALAPQVGGHYDDDLNIVKDDSSEELETEEPRKLSKKDRQLLEKYGGSQTTVKGSRLQFWHKAAKKKRNKKR